MAVLIIFVLLAVIVGLGLRFLYKRPRGVPDDLRRADSAQAQGSYDPQAVTDAAFDASVGPIPDWSTNLRSGGSRVRRCSPSRTPRPTWFRKQVRRPKDGMRTGPSDTRSVGTQSELRPLSSGMTVLNPTTLREAPTGSIPQARPVLSARQIGIAE
jgi:hypothetical protein